MYGLAWLVVRLLLALPEGAEPSRPLVDVEPPGRPVDAEPSRPPVDVEPPGRPVGAEPLPRPDFARMAVSLQNRLVGRLARGEITREQYRCGIEALAAAAARRRPASPPERHHPVP